MSALPEHSAALPMRLPPLHPEALKRGLHAAEPLTSSNGCEKQRRKRRVTTTTGTRTMMRLDSDVMCCTCSCTHALEHNMQGSLGAGS